MVNFRIYEDSNHLFKNLIIPRDEDWATLEPMIFLGRYLREKTTGILYRIWGLYHCPDFKTKGYHLRESLQNPYLEYPNHFPTKLSSQDVRDIYCDSKHLHQFNLEVTLNIAFRNNEDYLRAVKDLNICQTHILDVPISSLQTNSHTPKLYERFENPVKDKEETLYLYKPSD